MQLCPARSRRDSLQVACVLSARSAAAARVVGVSNVAHSMLSMRAARWSDRLRSRVTAHPTAWLTASRPMTACAAPVVLHSAGNVVYCVGACEDQHMRSLTLTLTLTLTPTLTLTLTAPSAEHCAGVSGGRSTSGMHAGGAGPRDNQNRLTQVQGSLA